ncbi:MAG: hypothetical protein DDT22_00218 [candidate division WS2 bacterium]|nr:hypothetical protein [Candidatus Lithacetigena glycinireducens]
MELLSERDKKQLKTFFEKELKEKIHVVYFTQGEGNIIIPGKPKCMYCRETETILKEISSLSDKIQLEIHDFIGNAELAQGFNIDKIPATIIKNENDLGLRFFGIPSGYEFSAFVETLVMVSQGKTRLKDTTKKKLSEYLDTIKEQILIQVFVTPTCPYCTRMVSLAYQFAMEFPQISTHIIEATEFPYLADKYSVFGVPKTVINDKVEIEGAVSEELFLDNLFKLIRS